MPTTRGNTLFVALLGAQTLALAGTGCHRPSDVESPVGVARVLYKSDGTVVASMWGEVRFYDAAISSKPRTVRLLPPGPERIFAPACHKFSGDRRICALRYGGTIEIYSTETGALIKSFEADDFPKEAARHGTIALSPDGTHVAIVAAGLTNGAPSQLTIRRISDGQSVEIALPPGQESARWDPELVFSPDGAVLYASRVTAGEVSLGAWNTADASPIWVASVPDPQHPGAFAYVDALALSADGSLLATGGSVVNLWRTSNGSRQEEFAANLQPTTVYTLDVAPDNRNIVATFLTGVVPDPTMFSMDGSINAAWPNTDTGACFDASFSPDGTRVVAACNTWVKIWDVTSGALLHKRDFPGASLP